MSDGAREELPKKTAPDVAAPNGNGGDSREASPTVRAPSRATLARVYADIAATRGAVIENRKIGVRLALANMKDADPPTVGEQVLAVAAVAGVGLVSGYISTRISKGIADLGMNQVPMPGELKLEPLSEAATAAFQTAVDDGGKFAFDAIRNGMRGASEMNAFFASEEAGLEASRLALALQDNARIERALDQLEAVQPGQRDGVLAAAVKHATGVLSVATKEVGQALDEQYRGSLTAWLGATARGDLGTSDEHGGTDLEDAVGDWGPNEHRKHRGHDGIVYINFGNRDAKDRLAPKSIRITGITSKALAPLRRSKIGDLKMPIVASGYLHDGSFVDGSTLFNNEIAFGWNEEHIVWVSGHENAIEAMIDATGTDRDTQAAEIKLLQLESHTLENAEATE